MALVVHWAASLRLAQASVPNAAALSAAHLT